MAQATIINKFGKITGWNAITTRMLGRDLEAIAELSYTDNQQMENEYGAGKYPIGQSEGNYAAKASISLYSEELKALQASLAGTGLRIQDIPAFPIVVQYEHNGFLYKDVIQNCRLMDNGREVKQGDGKIVHKIGVLTSHIDWNVK